jgi:hypothetical protein
MKVGFAKRIEELGCSDLDAPGKSWDHSALVRALELLAGHEKA